MRRCNRARTFKLQYLDCVSVFVPPPHRPPSPVSRQRRPGGCSLLRRRRHTSQAALMTASGFQSDCSQQIRNRSCFQNVFMARRVMQPACRSSWKPLEWKCQKRPARLEGSFSGSQQPVFVGREGAGWDVLSWYVYPSNWERVIPSTGSWGLVRRLTEAPPSCGSP